MSLTDRNSPPRLRRLTEPLRRHTTVSFWSSKSWGAETTTLSPRRQSTSLDSARLSIQRFPTAYKKQILHGYNLHWKDLRKWLLERFKAHLQLEQYLPSADVDPYTDDLYHLWLPEELSKEDVLEIDKTLRKKYDPNTDPTRHASYTPDPSPEP